MSLQIVNECGIAQGRNERLCKWILMVVPGTGTELKEQMMMINIIKRHSFV